MNRDDIIRMAREAEIDITCDTLTCHTGFVEQFEKFAALVAAAERKFWMEQIEVECNEAVLAEREACTRLVWSTTVPEDEYISPREAIANAIRARGNK